MQNESRGHLGSRRVPMPPTKVTRRCHSLRSQAVLCHFWMPCCPKAPQKPLQCLTKSEKCTSSHLRRQTSKNVRNVGEFWRPRTQTKWILLESGGNLHIPANLPTSTKIPPQTDSIWTSWAVFLRSWAWRAGLLKHWVDIGNGGPAQSEPSRVRSSQSGQQKLVKSQKR